MESKKVIVPNDILFEQVSEIIAKGKEVTILTKGNSMLPFIRGDKDSAVLKSFKELAVRDIVLAEIAPGHYVLHRIIEIKDKVTDKTTGKTIYLEGDQRIVVLMGDGNLAGTEICRVANVKAKAIGVIKNGKRRDCNTSFERFCATLWKFFLPFRRILLGVYRRLFYEHI